MLKVPREKLHGRYIRDPHLEGKSAHAAGRGGGHVVRIGSDLLRRPAICSKGELFGGPG
jgi:hypothetical protein